MTNGDKPIYITRGEFYPAMITIWVFISVVIEDLLRPGWRWLMGLLWVASLVMVVSYLLQNVRSIKAQKRSGKSL